METRILMDALDAQGIAYEVQMVSKPEGPLEGIVLGTGRVRPTIYPSQLECSVIEAIDICIQALENPNKPDIDESIITDWTRAKELVKLAIRPVRSDDIATVNILDVQLYFRVWLTDEASFSVTEKVLDLWDISKDELLAKAMVNTVDDFEIMSLRQKMIRDFGFDIPDEESDEVEDLYFAGSERYGAAILAFPGQLKKSFERFDDEFYILPSSVHEILIVRRPRGNEEEVIDSLKDMVSTINDTEVAPEDRLSDNIYKLDTKLGKIIQV